MGGSALSRRAGDEMAGRRERETSSEKLEMACDRQGPLLPLWIRGNTLMKKGSKVSK